MLIDSSGKSGLDGHRCIRGGSIRRHTNRTEAAHRSRGQPRTRERYHLVETIQRLRRDGQRRLNTLPDWHTETGLTGGNCEINHLYIGD